MNKIINSKITSTDLVLAAVYFSILITQAKINKNKNPILTYGDLVTEAKKQFPDSSEVQSAIAVSTGRRLDVVRMFTKANELPDLTSLVVNQGTRECGPGFTRSFDPIEARNLVLDFDWSKVTSEFDGFVSDARAAIKPRKKIKEDRARELMSEYYQTNKAILPKNIKTHRELIIELIADGCPVDEAFAQAISL